MNPVDKTNAVSYPNQMLLYVQLFGLFKIMHGKTAALSTDIPLPSRSTAKTLLAYLLLHRHKTHNRSQLAFLLAPDSSEERARRILSQALWQLRQTIPTPLIQTDGDQIHIPADAPLRVDVDTFTALTAPHLSNQLTNAGAMASQEANALQEAIALYHGELLDGFYDDWVFLRREQLRENYLQALWLLAGWEKENGRFQPALNHLLQLIQADPLREAAHREAMRCYALLGRPEAALRQFDLCAQLLQKELELTPEPATSQLRQEIIAQREAKTIAPPINENIDAPPLVGREKERAALLRLLKNGAKQQGGIALIESAAGTGKTRLLQAVAQDAEWRSYQILRGAATETSATVPYGVLIAALRTALTPLRTAQLHEAMEPVWIKLAAHLLPELMGSGIGDRGSGGVSAPVAAPQTTSPDPHPLTPDPITTTAPHEQMRLLEAMVRLLIRWSAFAPLLLILEDVHAADSATFDALALLAHRLAGHRMVLLVSYRGAEARTIPFVWDGLQALDEIDNSLRLALTDLPAPAASQLIRAALQLDTPAPTFEQRIFEATNGNPLFILETLRALRDSGTLRRDPQGGWATDWDELTIDYREIAIPERLENAIHGRIERLNADARVLLEITAVLDHQFDLALLNAISPLSRRQTLMAISDLIQQQFIIESAADYAFSHQTIQQTAYAGVTGDALKESHRRAAAALAELRPHAIEAIARHYEKAAQPARAVPYYRQSAQNALHHFALATARLHLDNAIALAAPAELPPAEQFALLAQRETVARVMGDNESRRHDLAAMARLAQSDSAQAIETERRYVQYYTNAAEPDFDKAAQHAANGLQRAEAMADPVAIAAAHAAWGHALTIQGNMEQALPHFDIALAHHNQVDDPAAHVPLLLNYAMALRMVARHHDALEAVQAALVLQEQSGDKTAQVNALSELAALHHEQGDNANAIAQYEQALALAREIGYRYREATVLVNWGNLLWFAGDIKQTMANYEAASVIFGELGNVHLEAQLRGNLASFLLYPFADFGMARHHAEWALAHCRRLKDLVGVGQALTTLSSIALEEGDLDAAHRYHAEGLTAMRESTGGSYLHAMMLRDGAVLALTRDEPVAALAFADDGLSLCAESGMADIGALLTAVRGIALLHLNRPQEALAATSTAMETPRDGVNQDYVIPMRHATVLDALGKTAEAAEAWDEAYRLLNAYVASLTPAQQAQSLSAIGDHRAIVAAWRAGRRVVAVRLPAATAPTGRPLRADEFVDVEWTVETAVDASIANKKERRQAQLLRLLEEAINKNAAPTVQDLVAVLGVSSGTIKRDLAALRAAGHDTPTRGRS